MTSQPQIRVLGSIEVEGDTGAITLGPRQEALLAVLAASAGSVVSVDVLIESIWPNDASPDRLGALHTLASRLRPRLPDGVLTTRSPGYVLEAGPDVLDSAQFERLVQSAGTASPGEALSLLDQAISLWHGPAFGMVSDRPAVQLRAGELDALHTIAQERRAQAMMSLGRADEAVLILEGLIGEHPFREQPVSLVMEALASSGRQTDALRHYSAFRESLAKQTGLEPSADLRRIEDAVLNNEFANSSGGSESGADSGARPHFALRPNTLNRRPGESIAYATIGSGPPLIFMPGWISSIDAFTDGTDPRGALLMRLAQDFTVTVFDRYGTGLSTATNVDVSLEGSVDEIRAVLDVVDGSPTILASSAAGPSALLAAAENQAISHLVLLCTYASGPSLFTDAQNQTALIELVEQSWGFGSRILADMIVPGIDSADRSVFARFQRRAATPDIAAGYLRQMYGADASAALTRIEQPCLVMHYREDPAIPYAGSRQLALGIRRTELVPLDGPYHTPPIEHVEGIAARIKQFVASDIATEQ